MSLVLFPSQPFNPGKIDPDCEAEQLAARDAGFATALVDHTRIVAGAAAAAVERVTAGDGAAMYRGWMLSPSQYETMHFRTEGPREEPYQHSARVPDVSLSPRELSLDRGNDSQVCVASDAR